MTTRELLDLWDYRRRVEAIYTRVRSMGDPRTAWEFWVRERSDLFLTHPQSPLPGERRTAAPGYFDYDPRWRLTGVVEDEPGLDVDLGHSGAGRTGFRRFATIAADSPAGTVRLSLLWLDSYGGGVFLPFRDGTNGVSTYGGGRYLLDTVKGADLGRAGRDVVLDFNFAYHPSCVHDPRWSCPLSPPENRLGWDVPVGERL